MFTFVKEDQKVMLHAHVFAVHFTVGCTLDNKAEHSIAKVSGLTHIAKW